jgi:hypothetical protein
MGVTLSRKLLLLALGLMVMMVLGSALANADTDPATLHIGAGAGTACATGCAGAPNLIGSGNTVDVFQTSEGTPAAVPAPQLLILGVANDTTNLFATDPISGVTYFNPYTGQTTGGTAGSSSFATGTEFAGMSSPTAGTGFFGDMTSGQEVYSFLGLGGAGVDASNNFVNWSGADLAINGITATNFGIYAFDLTGATLGPSGLINILFNSGVLPLGTYAVAYSQNSVGTPYVTAFTEAGLTATTTTVPEPRTLMLLGTGLLGLALTLKRRVRVTGLST